MPDQIFISYRRDDAAYVTGHINDLLRNEFGDESVFTDVDNIALGVDFRMVLDQSVSQCHVLLAVIGDNWLTVKNQDGTQRLQDPADFVRIEIESALRRNIPVIPLLVSGATMPKAEDLPDSLKDLAFRNGTQIRPAPDFKSDMDRLIRNLKAYLRSIREDVDDAEEQRQGTDTGRNDETEQHEARTDSGLQRDAGADRRGSGRESMLVGDDETTRKQVELGIGHKPAKKRWATRLWMIAVFLVAGMAWYYIDQNPEKVQAVLTAVQAPGAGSEENLATGDNAVDAAADSDVAAIDEAGTDANAVPQPGAETLADLTVSNATVSNEGVAPIMAADPTIETSANSDAGLNVETDTAANLVPDVAIDAGDDTGVDLQSNAAPGDMVDGEVIYSPGTRRQADASGLISEGVSLAATGDYAGAIRKFDEAIQLDVEPAFVYRQRGIALHALGQYEAAVNDFDAAIRLSSDDVNAYYSRGASHTALQNYAAAVTDYDDVIRLDPEFADAYSKRADAHEAIGNVEEAARDRAIVAVFETNRDNPR